MDTFDSISISGKSCFFDCRAIRTRPSLGSGGVEAVESARPISLPLYGLFLSFVLPRPGAPCCTTCFLFPSPKLAGGPGSIECFSYGGASHVSIEPPSLLSSPPFRSSVGSRARAVIGKAGYTKRYL